MSVALVTGCGGLVGSETVSLLCGKGFDVAGIDNNMRSRFFGADGSVLLNLRRLQRVHKHYRHYSIDIRNAAAVNRIFSRFGRDIALVVHAAAQPSHDWAARDPRTDFSVNAVGTLNLLEACRAHSPETVFIFTSTNKVYGDRPNALPVEERPTRYELPEGHRYYNGIDESMSIDFCTHSLFGVSKASADLLVQEYGRYFYLRTGVFRGGCLTGPHHAGAQLHGFLSYLVKCCVTGRPYTVAGYKGKQVRDNIHVRDLVEAFYHFFKKPVAGEVYNIGGGRFANISVLEAISVCERLSGRKMSVKYEETPRRGDHIWWVSDVSKFKRQYPAWRPACGIEATIEEIYREVAK